MVQVFLKKFGKVVIPLYKPFGRLLLLTHEQESYSVDEYNFVLNNRLIKNCLDDIINSKIENLNFEKTLKGCQNHFISNYFLKL